MLHHVTFLAQSSNGICEGSREMSRIRSETDGSFASLNEYNNKDRQICQKELTVLQMLKGEFTHEVK